MLDPQVLAAFPGVLTGEAERQAASTDRSGYRPPTLPDAVVRATSIDEVVRTMQLATEHRVPVVVRGAGSGLAGGASAHEGELVLDLSGMNRILKIDPVEQLAVVEPGVLNAQVSIATAEHGLFYAPDPASMAFCSIGGNLATNAGGMRCAKYGVTRESVLSMKVVLADGRLLVTGAQTIKAVTGYDLNSLFIGSEGTLGVVVEATLRLRPIPVRTETVAAYFAGAPEAAAAASAVIAARVQPSLLELIDGRTLQVIDDVLGTDHRAHGGALLIGQTDGFGAEAEREAVIAAIRPFAQTVVVAASQEEADALLRTRREAIPSLETKGTTMIGDVGVPRGALAAMVDGLGEISDEVGVPIYAIAHAADGNLHPMLLVDGVPEAKVKDAMDRMFRLARSLGGTLTGEHGVGVLKLPWVADEVGDVSHDIQRRIRQAIDPLGILNPGKAI
jgi:glycolate oxidase